MVFEGSGADDLHGGRGGGCIWGPECVGISLVYMLKVFCPVSASAHISKVVGVMVDKSPRQICLFKATALYMYKNT